MLWHPMMVHFPLVLTNIGGAAPGILDRSTQGSPAKYAFCFAESEADNPWTPLHVERGFEPFGRSRGLAQCAQQLCVRSLRRGEPALKLRLQRRLFGDLR